MEDEAVEEKKAKYTTLRLPQSVYYKLKALAALVRVRENDFTISPQGVLQWELSKIIIRDFPNNKIALDILSEFEEPTNQRNLSAESNLTRFMANRMWEDIQSWLQRDYYIVVPFLFFAFQNLMNPQGKFSSKMLKEILEKGTMLEDNEIGDEYMDEMLESQKLWFERIMDDTKKLEDMKEIREEVNKALDRQRKFFKKLNRETKKKYASDTKKTQK